MITFGFIAQTLSLFSEWIVQSPLSLFIKKFFGKSQLKKRYIVSVIIF